MANERALRALFADFTVAFDRSKTVQKGNAAINTLAKNAQKAGQQIDKAFGSANKSMQVWNVRANTTGQKINELFSRHVPQAFERTSFRVSNVGRSFDEAAKKSLSLNGAMGGLTRAFGAFGLALGSAAIVRGMSTFITNTIRMGDELDKTSTQLGITAHDLQSLRLAAELSGAGTERMNVALAQLSQKLFMAHSRGGEMATLFRRVGIEYRDSAGNMRQLQDVMDDLADAIQRNENPTERVGIAMQIFGENGRYMLPMLLEGSAGMRRMRDELDSLGGAMDDVAIHNAVELNDNLTRLRTSWTSLRSFLALRMFPALDWLTRKGIELGRTISDLVSRSHILESAIGVLSGVLIAAGVATATAWGPTALVLGAAAAAIAVLVLLVDDLAVTAEGGDSVIRHLIDSLVGVGTTAHMLQTITTALADIRAYAQVLGEDWDATWARIKEATEPVISALIYISDLIRPIMDAMNVLPQLGVSAGGIANALSGLNPFGEQGPLRAMGRIGEQRRVQEARTTYAAARSRYESLPVGSGARILTPEGRAPEGSGTVLADRPSRGGGNVSNNVDARTNLNVSFNGITDTEQMQREMRTIVRDSETRQARQVQAALTRQGS